MKHEAKHKLEVGTQIEIDGRMYWIAKVEGDQTLNLMRDPDDVERACGRKSKSTFWPTFWCIVLIAILLRLLF